MVTHNWRQWNIHLNLHFFLLECSSYVRVKDKLTVLGEFKRFRYSIEDPGSKGPYPPPPPSLRTTFLAPLALNFKIFLNFFSLALFSIFSLHTYIFFITLFQNCSNLTSLSTLLFNKFIKIASPSIVVSYLHSHIVLLLISIIRI